MEEGTDDIHPQSGDAAAANADALLLAVAAAPPRAPPGRRSELPRSTMIAGTYRIDGVLGRGAMGIVYLATDVQLDRPVALKLHVSPDDEAGSSRMWREARAMARLAHPNVLTVYEVGEFEHRVYIAMERVEGGTVREWLRTSRAWREVVDVFVQAALGLAAAHSVGLVHRDFKPSNILLATDGRARVADFGLARAGLEALDVGSTSSVSASSATDRTRTGVTVGTPSYMAPEQLDGGTASPQADQFSFFVALHEALYGVRPFVGETIGEMQANALAGRVRPPVAGRRVPGWLRSIVLQGLRPSPADRFPDMQAVIARLRADPTRRRWAWVGLVSLAIVGVLAWGWRQVELAQAVAECEAEGASIATVWPGEDDAARTTVHDALLATDVSFAATTVEALPPWLDAWARTWQDARTRTCMLHDVDEQWDDHLDARAEECLDERRGDLAALVDELARADAMAVQKAVLAAASLPRLEPCTDAVTLAHRAALPPDLREEVMHVRADLSRAEALLRAGKSSDSVAAAEVVLADAESLAWTPVVAEARIALGAALESTGEYKRAERELVDAYVEASEAEVPELAERAATSLIAIVGDRLARHDDALLWARLAEVELVRLGVDERDIRAASRLNHVANVHRARGAYAEAKVLLERALAIRESTLGPDHPDVAAILNDLANVHFSQHAFADAKPLYERALAILERTLGPDHPHVAASLANLGNVLFSQDAPADAMALYERALSIRERALGVDHADVAATLHNIAAIHNEQGEHAKAKALHERALEMRERTLGPDHPEIAVSLVSLANVHVSSGALGEAKPLYERAIAINEKTLGPDHPDLATSLRNLAVVHAQQGAYEEARALYERALAILEKAHGPDHSEVAASLARLANLHTVHGAYAEAQPLYERVLSIREQALGPDHLDVATTMVALASVHRIQGAHEEAKTLYERALSIRERALGAEHPDVAWSVNNLANLHYDRGEYADAKRLFQRALSLRERSLGADHRDVAYALVGLGQVALAEDRPADAVAVLDRALDIREANRTPPHELVEIRFELSRALWLSRQDRPRAVELARLAGAGCRELGSACDALGDVERWVAERITATRSRGRR